MSPTCTEIQPGNDIVSFPEKFMSSPPDNSLQTEDVEKGDKRHGYHAPNDVSLIDEFLI